ncbi:MAG: hypothetical protein RQ971_00995 [Armatimonadota bacterium]|jgi:hypothetical protein|nr:hypothetical protein [Armatimonadota bacterium]
MGYYCDDEPYELLEDTYAIEAEWRELVGDRDWDYVYYDGEWEHSEDVYDEVLSEIGYYEGDFDW